MAREIRLSGIGEHFEDKVIRTVKKATLLWEARVKKATPVDTGRLRAAWQTDIKPLEGTVTNNVVYAEPVCFGTNLPPSWGGTYRTRQKTVAGFPELIGKELEQYVMKQIRRGI